MPVLSRLSLSRHYDRALMICIVVVPLVPMLLYKWYYSLDTWYVPWGETRSDYFDADFEQAVNVWLDNVADRGDAVYVISDAACPCAKPVLKKLNQAMDGVAPARVFDPYDGAAVAEDAYGLLSLVRFMPALPTALVVKSGQLAYVGPLVTGNLCSQEADLSPPLAAYLGASQSTVYNWLSEGCYCRLAPERLVSNSPDLQGIPLEKSVSHE